VKYWREPLDLKDIRVPRGEIHVLVERWKGCGVRVERCKGCGWCIEYCPRGVLEVSDEINSKGYHPPRAIKENACVSCGLCELLCPEFAIYVVETEGEVVFL
jgi:2-oxoglutarate ferredoxin oxidoreductase subunit delta